MWVKAVYLLATVFLARLVHLLFRRSAKGGGPLYWWRWARLVLEVWLERSSRINSYDVSSNPNYGLCGIEATPYEKELERPKPLTTDRHGDEMTLCAVDRHGRAVVARVVRLTKRRASIFLCVVDHTGAVYTLPNQPDTSQVNVCEDGWRGAGLSLTCVDPMMCWRLKFSGLLRRGTREEYLTDGEEEEEEEVHHARLDLLWQALHRPVDVWEEVSPRLLAHAIAQDPNPSLPAFLCGAGEGYEQWGALHGQVTLHPATDPATVTLHPATDPAVWYLRGPRRHRWGLNTCPDRALETMVYFNNGDVCSLHGHTTSTTQYVAGYIKDAQGLLRPVSWTDLNLHGRDDLPDLGNNLIIKLTGGGRTYDVWQRLGEGVAFYTGAPWSQGHRLHLTTAAATQSYGWGITLFSHRYSGQCPVPARESLTGVEVPRVMLDDEAPLVVALDDPVCRNPVLTGGKAASLALLASYRQLLPHHQEQYEVPRGVVVTKAAWLHQLNACPVLQQAVRGVRQALPAAQPAQLKDACARAEKAWQKEEVTSAVAQAVLQAVQQHLHPSSSHDSRWAVRSSGCGEDGQETSAAGQNQTLLGVRGHAHLLQALARCWASMFSYHSVEYRRQRGQEVEAGMGVVVQQMVQPQAAGVMFTVDPVTVSPANITITANYGLGETVVAASAEPDTIVVRRDWRGRLSLASRTLGAKTTKCVMQEDGGTVEVEVAKEERGHHCLSEAMALRLARLAVYLQDAFASPRDVEFAVSQERVFLLQARPITSLDAWTDYEVIHEQDSALLADHELLTRANTGEVFPGSATPLTLSVVLPGLNVGFARALRYMKWPFRTLDPYRVLLCMNHHRQVFINMLEVLYRTQDPRQEVLAITLTGDFQLFGHEVTTPQYQRWAKERFGVMTALDSLAISAVMLHKMATYTSRLGQCRRQFWHTEVGGPRALSAASLYSEISRRLPDLLQVSLAHQSTSTMSSIYHLITLTLLTGGTQGLSQENKSDMAKLMSGAGTESGDVPSALQEIARVLAESEDVAELLAMTPEEARVWLESHPGDVGDAFREFLLKHGHRCYREFDLSSSSWSLDSHGLVQTLQVMVRHPGPATGTSASPQQTVQEAIAGLQTPLTRNIRRALGFLVPRCRAAVVHREASKSIVVKLLDSFKKAYRELGQLMVAEGRLPSPDLVFYLKHSELGDLVTAPSPSLLARAGRRRRLHPRLDQLKFPEISTGIPRPVIPEDLPEAAGRGSVQVLTGTAVCQGLVTAPVRVIISIQDAPTIQSGDVLVTHSTDIGWTPYFPILAGVVTEIGGLISHGAVVAREYGLPCVVGVAAATHILKSGEMIELNATRGTITRLNFQPTDNNHDSDNRSDDDSNSKSANSKSGSDNSLNHSDKFDSLKSQLDMPEDHSVEATDT